MSGILNSNPGWSTGTVPTASAWDGLWGGKVDGIGGIMASGSTPGTDISSGMVTTYAPFGTPTAVPRSPAQRWSERIHIKDFGATGYGVADSSPAFNAMTAYVREWIGTNAGATLHVDVPNDYYICRSPLNFTGINASGSINTNSVPQVLLKFNGAWLVGCFNGGIVFDHFGSNFLKVYDLNITAGVSVPGYSGTPAWGMAGGCSSSANLGICNNHEFYNPSIIGSFSSACAYWISTETTTVYSPRFYNNNPSSGSYCNVTDGQNHFGVSSTFSPMLLPADTANSFNSMLFVQPDFRHSGGGAARWIGCSTAHEYRKGFISTAASVPATVLWQSQTTGGGQAVIQLYDDVVNQGSMSDIYLIAGPQAAPPLYGLTYVDPGPQATNSIFKCAPSVSGVVYASDCVVRLAGYVNGGMKMWDNTANWNWAGDISVPNGGNLCSPLPTQFQGRLAIGHQEALYSPLIALGTNSTNGPTLTTGNGAPSGSNVQPNGSLYINHTGTTGTRWYISAGSGTWAAVSGI